jgi:hypothetical protein
MKHRLFCFQFKGHIYAWMRTTPKSYFRQKFGFNHRVVDMEFVVDKLALGQVFLQALWSFLANYFSTSAPYSFIKKGWHKRQFWKGGTYVLVTAFCRKQSLDPFQTLHHTIYRKRSFSLTVHMTPNHTYSTTNLPKLNMAPYKLTISLVSSMNGYRH